MVKRILWKTLFVLAAVSTLITVGAASAPAVQIKVMTYNIHQEVGQSAGYDSFNAERIGRIVNFYKPDVFTINELQGNNPINAAVNLKNWINNYLTYLGNTYYTYIGTYTDGYILDAIVSKYPISDAKSESVAPRGLVSALIDLPGSVDVRVYTTHLKAMGDATSAKTRQAGANRTAYDISTWSSIPANSSIPYILMGDMNEDEDNPQSPPISTSYCPITTLKSAYLNDLMPDNMYGSTKTISSSNPTSRFDYILYSWQLKPVLGAGNCLVVDTNQMYLHQQLISPLTKYDSAASDHLCVLGTFDVMDNMVGNLRKNQSGCQVSSISKTVTASFSDCFYIEEANRVSAIRVNSTANPAVGSTVNITGAINLSTDGEDAINASGVRIISLTASEIRPIAMKNIDINTNCAASKVIGQRGPFNGALLVKTWGKVVSVGTGTFNIDDGSGYPILISSSKNVSVGSYVSVTGVVGFHMANSESKPTRYIRTRSDSDVQTYNL